MNFIGGIRSRYFFQRAWLAFIDDRRRVFFYGRIRINSTRIRNPWDILSANQFIPSFLPCFPNHLFKKLSPVNVKLWFGLRLPGSGSQRKENGSGLRKQKYLRLCYFIKAFVIRRKQVQRLHILEKFWIWVFGINRIMMIRSSGK